MEWGNLIVALAEHYSQDEIMQMTPYFAYYIGIQLTGRSVLAPENGFSARVSEAEKKELGWI